MILQIYTYLRDAKAKSFVDVKLLGNLALKWHGMATTPAKVPKAPRTPPPLQPHPSGRAPIVIQWICMMEVLVSVRPGT
jgi:hypothetical protein